MKVFFNKIFIAIIFSSLNIQASELFDSIQTAFEHSSLIRNQTEITNISSGDIYRRYFPREPQLQYNNNDSNSSEAYSLSLTTSFPGKAFFMTSYDEAKYKSDQLELQAKKYDLAKLIIQSFLDCSSVTESFEIQKTSLLDIEILQNLIKNMYENGHSTQAENISIELQLHQAQSDLDSLQDKKSSICKKWELTAIRNGINFQSVQGIPEEIDVALINLIGSSTADETRAQSQIQLLQATEKTIWLNQLPDLTFGLTENNYFLPANSPNGNSRTRSYSVSVTVPLFYPFVEQIESKRLKIQAQVDRAAAETVLLQTDSELDQAQKDFINYKKRLKQLRTKDLHLGHALVESATLAYKRGKLGFSDLMLSRKTLNDLKNQEIQMKVNIITSQLKCLSQCEVNGFGDLK